MTVIFFFGCVALRDDGAIITSTNIRTQLPMIAAHAEARALRKCGQEAILWIARIDRNRNRALARPCSGCQTLIKNRCVKRVYYTVDNNTYSVWDV